LLFPRLLLRTPPQEAPGAAALFLGVRWAAEKGVRHYLAEPQASLATGVLLGGSGGLDADVRLQLQRSGLAHLVAIDGYKQVVVAGALGALAVRLLGPRLAALPILLGIAAYTLLTGAHPSAVRAALMVGLATLASLTGRLADPLTSLLLAAVAMAAFEPRILLDVGLQLSLSATLGLVLLWPRLRRRLRTLPSFVAEPAGLTLAVTLATLPVVLSVFQLVSLVSPVAHIVAVPLLPLVLGSTALLALVSPIEAVATPVGWLAWLPSTLLLQTIEFFGNLPGAALSTGRLPTLAAVCLALGLLAWGLLDLPEAAALRSVWVQRASRVQVGPAAVCVAACLGAASVLQIVRPDGRLHVQALEAGRGEAVFIRGPTGRTALVVRGKPDAARVTDQVADHLALWEHKLDTLLTLDAAAQAAIEPLLAHYPAEQQLDADADARIDLGGGAVVDIYASGGLGQAEAGVSVSFGEVWLIVAGRPPPVPFGPSTKPSPPSPGYERVSDGRELWAAP
jgi:competence protein ComEC